MSAYSTAIDLTVDTVTLRARYFRNQIIVVCATGIGVAAAAVTLRSASVLWGWLVLIPVCGLFFYIDSRVIGSWCVDVLAPWARRELDLAAWLQAVRAHPMLPKGTLEGMFSRLPAAGDLVAEQKLQASTRRAIAAANREANRFEADRLLIRVMASALVVAAVLMAIALHTWTPLVSLVLLGIVPLATSWCRRRRALEREAEVALCRAEHGFSEEDFVTILRRGHATAEMLANPGA